MHLASEFVLVDAAVRTDRIAELTKENERQLGYQTVHAPDPKFPNLTDYERMRLRVADNNNLILVQDMGSLYDVDFMPTHKDELPAMINQLREWVKDGRVIVDNAGVAGALAQRDGGHRDSHGRRKSGASHHLEDFQWRHYHVAMIV